MKIVHDKEIITRGKLIKTASLKKEWDEDITSPEVFIEHLKDANIKADIFTFAQRLPHSKPKYAYHMEWDSVAAIPISTYDNWLENQVVKNSRKKINYAKRKGVQVRSVDFDDKLIEGILNIYHEIPVIQGQLNRQYNTDFKTAKKLNATFLDRAQFIGAFYEEELIAYIKLVHSGKIMRTMGILSTHAHRNKSPMNLLIARAVEICAENNMDFLTYGKFNYGKRGSKTLREFKTHLGFESIILPRYYIPLNTWGRIILKANLHHPPVEYFPVTMIKLLKKLRKSYYLKKFASELQINK